MVVNHQAKSQLNKHGTSVLLGSWLVILFAALILSIFLHETGHGLGAKLDGIHISTGFNRIGNPGLAPGDPGFRTGLTGGVWTGLLGPVTSWLLAFALTLWLYRIREATVMSVLIGALAVASGLARAIPLAVVLFASIAGGVVMEDEVHWGLWYIGKVLRPELGTDGAQALVFEQGGGLFAYPALWIPVVVSFGISLVCLTFAYRQLTALWKSEMSSWAARGLVIALSIGIWLVVVPVLNVLDRVIRINW